MQRIAADCASWSLRYLVQHVLYRGSVRAGEAGEHFVSHSKGEVVQHEDDFLPVFAKRRGVMNDERRGHQVLLLHVLMGMHPIRARIRSIVVGLKGAVLDRRATP